MIILMGQLCWSGYYLMKPTTDNNDDDDACACVCACSCVSVPAPVPVLNVLCSLWNTKEVLFFVIALK